jgi:integrase
VIKIDSNERWKEWTKRDFKLILRLFARWLNKRYNLNLDTSFININVRNKVKLPEEILTEDDVRKLVNFCDNLRDKAFIYTFYESGARVGEFLNLRLKHVEFVEHGAFLTFTKSKTKPRKIRVINSAPLLKMWIECHPFKNNPEAWLWITEFNRRQKRRYTLLMYKGAQIAEETSTKKWH